MNTAEINKIHTTMFNSREEALTAYGYDIIKVILHSQSTIYPSVNLEENIVEAKVPSRNYTTIDFELKEFYIPGGDGSAIYFWRYVRR